MNSEPLTILLIEDNPAHAELVKRSFQDHSLENRIFHVSDGEAALDYLFRRGEYADPESSPRPHIILLDLRLPKIDGLEVLKEIKNSNEVYQIPVVVLTTSEAEEDVTRACESYTNAYLVKPVTFEMFSQVMNDLGIMIKNLGPYGLNWNRRWWS